MDLVSVVIPVYNAERYLAETLASVFAQTYPNLEIIVTDDGSHDRSLEILKRHRDRIVLVSQNRGGPAAARNRAVREAKGEWIAFLDADDLWAPEKIRLQLDSCGNRVWSHTDSVFLGGVNDGKRHSAVTFKYQGNVLENLIRSNFIGTSSVVVSRRHFLDSGGFDESLLSIEDWELWTRLAKCYEIGYVDAPLMKYRVHAKSASRSTRETLPNHLKVIEKVFGDGGPGSASRHLMSIAKAQSYSICSHVAEEQGDFGFALRCSLLAFGNDPWRIRRWDRAFKSSIKYLLARLGIEKHLNP